MLEVKGIKLRAFSGAIALLGLVESISATDSGALSEYLQSRFGFSPEQAQQRLEGERKAARTRQYAIELLGDDFAGSWYDADLNQLVVATVDERRYPVIRAIDGSATLRRNSLVELHRAQRRLDAFGRLNDTATAGIVSWYIDVVNNSLVIEHLTSARQASEDFLEIAGISRDVSVQFRVVEEFPSLAFDVRGGDQTDNATQIRPCSVGLPTTDGFIIAGHCGDTDDVAVGFNGQVMGVFGESSFPVTDRAWVGVNSNWTPKPEVDAYNVAGVRTITGEGAGLTVSPVNTTVCRYGRYSGERCGVVASLSAFATLRDPSDPSGNTTYTFHDLTKTTACLYSTDSGGPFLSSSGYYA